MVWTASQPRWVWHSTKGCGTVQKGVAWYKGVWHTTYKRVWHTTYKKVWHTIYKRVWHTMCKRGWHTMYKRVWRTTYKEGVTHYRQEGCVTCYRLASVRFSTNLRPTLMGNFP